MRQPSIGDRGPNQPHRVAYYLRTSASSRRDGLMPFLHTPMYVHTVQYVWLRAAGRRCFSPTGHRPAPQRPRLRRKATGYKALAGHCLARSWGSSRPASAARTTWN